MVAVACILALAAIGGGCAASDGPKSLPIDRVEYDRAFDAAVASLRDAGYHTAVRDRSGGVIESQPLRISGALEPWHAMRQAWSSTGESTLALQRRRAVIEFVPTTMVIPDDTGEPAPLAPPDIVGAAARDLRDVDGPLVMRVRISVERAHTPGIRQFDWTLSLTTRTFDPADRETRGVQFDTGFGTVAETNVLATSVWTPIGRDDDAERRLARSIRARLEHDPD